MPKVRTDLLLIGREKELERIQENIARGRPTLLVGPVGIGKTHLLRYLDRQLKRSIYLEQVSPIRATLLALLQHLHQQRHLKMEGLEVDYLAWPDLAKKLSRLNIRELNDLITASLRGRRYVLILDQLEGLTPSMANTMERLMGQALIIGAAPHLRHSLQKVWWAFERVEIPPLTKEESRRLLWEVAEADSITDPAMFESRVLAQANGNPYAIVEMVKQIAGEEVVGPRIIRDLQHEAGVRYLDITPAILIIGAGIIAARFVALGLNDTDMYIIAGSLGAFFFVIRYFLYRGMRHR